MAELPFTNKVSVIERCIKQMYARLQARADTDMP